MDDEEATSTEGPLHPPSPFLIVANKISKGPVILNVGGKRHEVSHSEQVTGETTQDPPVISFLPLDRGLSLCPVCAIWLICATLIKCGGAEVLLNILHLLVSSENTQSI